MSKNTVRRLLATWGSGDHGRLGDLSCTRRLVPHIVAALYDQDIAHVCCGGAHTLAVTADGTLFSFGLNDYGQLGHSPAAPFVPVPQVVPLPAPVRTVGAGRFHSLAVDDQGAVWSWGRNCKRQLGREGEHAAPQRVGALQGVAMAGVSAGLEHSLGWDHDGALYAWGNPQHGRLGLGPSSVLQWLGSTVTSPNLVRGVDGPVVHASAGDTSSAAVLRDGQVCTWGDGRLWQLGQPGRVTELDAPTAVPGVPAAQEVSVSGYFGCAVGLNTQLYVWGSNEHTVLGLGAHGAPSVVREPAPIPGLYAQQVSAGWQHMLVVSGNGRLYSCGWGGSMGDGYGFGGDQGAGGQLGVGDDLDRGEFTAVTLLQGAEGELVAMQGDEEGCLPRWRVVHASAGVNHSAAIIEGTQ